MKKLRLSPVHQYQLSLALMLVREVTFAAEEKANVSPRAPQGEAREDIARLRNAVGFIDSVLFNSQPKPKYLRR